MSELKFDSPQAALAHYGVPGMRWGHRKGDSNDHVSRKQNRQMNKEAENKFNEKKATTLYNEAKKGGEKTLIEVRLPGDFAQTVVTGKQFAEHLESGGVFDVRMTEVFATQSKAGEQYVLNDNKIGTYKKQDFRNK